MNLPHDDPCQFLEEAIRYRERAAEVFDRSELRESYLALARSYERLADALGRRRSSKQSVKD
jgi:hypothetical protein